ncbi:hypothetical protein HK414_19840 [Ramlibacter terrae]|uniref:DNA ligase D polymerase domain-containing protein n=1 Tax=Ramlibacter terrae TaxID=2732511 RepID=A0ABX6P7Q2_9BURK|nr:hypothetical protein HK414_19840 [Ramlibacter terrae]
MCEVTYNEWPEGGSLRHASFKGLREDKPAHAVERERPQAAKAPPPAKHALLKVTHGSRVIDPSTGLTKLDLVRWYAEAAPRALPHLAGRPAYIKRAPLGIEQPMVFQQHPEGMRGLRGTDPALWPGHDPAIAFTSVEDVVAAAQLGMVEVHTELHRRGHRQARPAGVRPRSRRRRRVAPYRRPRCSCARCCRSWGWKAG